MIVLRFRIILLTISIYLPLRRRYIEKFVNRSDTSSGNISNILPTMLFLRFNNKVVVDVSDVRTRQSHEVTYSTDQVFLAVNPTTYPRKLYSNSEGLKNKIRLPSITHDGNILIMFNFLHALTEMNQWYVLRYLTVNKSFILVCRLRDLSVKR